jgi:hypothetical protein
MSRQHRSRLSLSSVSNPLTPLYLLVLTPRASTHPPTSPPHQHSQTHDITLMVDIPPDPGVQPRDKASLDLGTGMGPGLELGMQMETDHTIIQDIMVHHPT